MEDSYIVHRRRKAAARKREKTPEPSTRREQQDSSDDEEEARRARMEKMAEDTERMEVENKMKDHGPEKADKEKKGEKKGEKKEEKKEEKREEEKVVVVQEPGKLHVETVTVVRKISKEEVIGAREREDDTAERSPLARKVPEVTRKADEEAKSEELKEKQREEVPQDKVGKEAKERPKETVTETKVEVRRVERRIKKKSKERLAERHSRSTDSSEIDEKSESGMKRTKSPEGKVRLRKAGRSRAGHDDVKKELSEKKVKDDDRSKEKKVSTRYSHTDTDDEPKHMKKSETFPRRSNEDPVMKRSATDVKKQIIPISNDSLIEDFARAQREYLLREKSILDPDPLDVFQDAEGTSGVRKRKTSVAHTEKEQEEIAASVASETASDQGKQPEEVKDTKEAKKRSWFSWIPFLRKKKEKVETIEPKPDEEAESKQIAISKKPEKSSTDAEEESKTPEKVTFMDFLRAMRDFLAEFKAFVAQNPEETRIMRSLRNRCCAELLLIIIYCGLGAIVFRFTEGAFETFYKCGVKRVKRDFLDTLWNYSHNMREDDWKSMARKKLMEFEEQLHTAHEAGVHTYSGQRSWTFLNAVVYCLTVITTIGYGHISPSTTTGRAITIVYAIFGIPMFLIILADFGKLFTRGIKFLWAFVRRVYYTGSCRKVRRTVPVQEVMKGVQLVYDLATFRRPSQMNPEDIEEMQKQAQQSQTVLNLDGNVPDTPGTPAMSTFAIDDEFNLPISVAIIILIGYIFVGATLYYLWEDWGFFESFYFVFISMSTIGFGDYVPKHPIYMMCSIIYLVFGLALTSMCINVVQVMLSDSFRQASQKIGATIGFEIAEDDGSVKPAPPPPVEVADVHTSVKESESEEKIAPKAKQEDVDL